MDFRNLLAIAALLLPLSVSGTDFSYTDTDGRPHSLKLHAGKWVLVNLWATWCTPCVKEMPELQALAESRKDLVVIGLAVDGSNFERVTAFASKLGVRYPIVAGNETMARQFAARGYPTSVLYDKAGRQVLRKEGMITREEIERLMK